MCASFYPYPLLSAIVLCLLVCLVIESNNPTWLYSYPTFYPNYEPVASYCAKRALVGLTPSYKVFSRLICDGEMIVYSSGPGPDRNVHHAVDAYLYS